MEHKDEIMPPTGDCDAFGCILESSGVLMLETHGGEVTRFQFCMIHSGIIAMIDPDQADAGDQMYDMAMVFKSPDHAAKFFLNVFAPSNGEEPPGGAMAALRYTIITSHPDYSTKDMDEVEEQWMRVHDVDSRDRNG